MFTEYLGKSVTWPVCRDMRRCLKAGIQDGVWLRPGLVCLTYQNSSRDIKVVNSEELFLKLTFPKDTLGIAGIPGILSGHLFSIVLEVLPGECQCCFWIS